MRWRRRGAALTPEEDPLEQHADAAARHFGFTPEERDEYLKLQRRLSDNPSAPSVKQLVKRQRKLAKAQRLAPTLKTRR